MKQTTLYQIHLQLNAKMSDFQGWQMPLYYTNASDEYHAVRAAAGLFDVGHLGRIELAGPGAQPLLQTIFTRNMSRLAEGAAVYGLICNDAGFVLDDAILFRLPVGQDESRYLLTTNAVNTDKILLWLKKNMVRDVTVSDNTQAMAQFALQGPKANSVLETLAQKHFKKLKLNQVKELSLAGTSVMVSRTGYTGEQGYELFVPAGHAEVLWNAVLNAGKEHGVIPCGMAARDMLRIEMGYLQYGIDIDETRSPLEAGLSACLDFKKDFIGKDALLSRKAEGVQQRLIGFELYDKGIPRSGGSIFSENREIGVVTSGNTSPQRRKVIGLGYVLTRYAQPGQEIEIEVKDREIAAKIIELPFYRKR